MLDALQGGLTIGLFLAGIYVPVAAIRIISKKVRGYYERKS